MPRRYIKDTVLPHAPRLVNVKVEGDAARVVESMGFMKLLLLWFRIAAGTAEQRHAMISLRIRA